MVPMQEMVGWAEGLERLHARLAPHFARTEPRQRVRAYVEGMLGVRSQNFVADPL